MKWILYLLFLPSFAFAKLNIVATTSDLKSLVELVGAERVEVVAIVKATQDPHEIEPKPSYMILFRNADLVVAQGLELESAWLKALISGSRNSKLAIMELGHELNPLDVRTAPVSRAEGDVHPLGNPHFQLDPVRMAQAALLVAGKLGQLDPSGKDFYLANAKKFNDLILGKLESWSSRLKGVGEIVTYHKTFMYFCDRFKIKCEIQLEPRPGIPPSASHLIDVLKKIQARKINVVLIENYFDAQSAQKLKNTQPSL